MSSYVAVANLAATKIGSEARITSPDDDRLVARTIKAVWDIERRAAIRDGAWNFAMRRAELAAESLSGGVPYPWTYSFPLPAESVRLIEVLNLSSRADYQLEGNSILCDAAGPLYIRFMVDEPEPALWDELFVEAFACRIAITIGARIAGTNFNQIAAERAYADALSRAKRVDARENPPFEQEESDWIIARMTGGSFPATPGGGW